MNARNLGWTIVSIAMLVAVVMWWSLRMPQHAPSVVEPTALAPTKSSSPQTILDAEPLALVRAPAQVVTQPIHDASANTLDQSDLAHMRVLVIDRTTRAPLPGMGVQLSAGPLEQYAFSNIVREVGEIVHTDANGRAVLNLPFYTHNSSIFAWDPAGHAGSAEHELGDAAFAPKDDIVLELSPDNDFVLWMRVVDEETNAPIADAHDVVPIDMNLPSSSPFPSYMDFQPDGRIGGGSDVNGLLLISGPTWTRHEIKLVSPGHTTVYVDDEKGHERADKAMIVTTPRSASVRLNVVDTNGLPVSGCRVSLSTASNKQERPRTTKVDENWNGSSWASVTDASGIALIADLPPDMELRGETSGVFNHRIPARLTLAPGEVRNVEWVVAGGVTLRGTLLDLSGAPIPDCEVWLMRTLHTRPGYFDDTCQANRAARTDASGRFVFASAERGRFWVGPGHMTNYPDTYRKDVAPFANVIDVAAQTDIDVELRAACGLYVSGRVIAPADKPLLEGTVAVEDHARGLSMSAPWKADGSFSIGPLMSGPLTLTAHSTSGYAPPEPLVVDAGTRDVKLEMRASTSISGRVVDDQGRKVQCSILLTPHGAASNVSSVEVRSAEGDFSFSGLAPGKYSLAAQSYGSQATALDDVESALGANVTDIVLRLAPGGLVRFRCSHPMAWNEVTLEQNGVRFVNRKFEGYERTTIYSPAGKVLLRLRNTDTGKQCEHDVDVDVGKVTDITIADEGQ